ncbi:hypothetical protein [Embleya sp. NPDC020630]|uniref:hypothetical protein n=1 Tax=Embleya sp. NPDC020630 TaxID=3363979 RepID=UPI0037A2F620
MDHDEPRSLTGHTDIVRASGFSPDGRTVDTTGGDRTMRLWNLSASLTGHSEQMRAVAFDRASDTLVATGGDGRVSSWNIAKTFETLQRPSSTPRQDSRHGQREHAVAVGRHRPGPPEGTHAPAGRTQPVRERGRLRS